MTPLRRQLQSMLRVEPREGGFTATFKLDPNLSILPDHFRNAPILPGVCMVQLVLLSAAQSLKLPDLHLRHLKNAKILRPILPNDQVRIEATITPAPDNSFIIKSTFTTESAQRCAEFSLTAGPAFPPLPSGAGRGAGELRTTPPAFPSPGIPGEGREGVSSNASPVTRVFNPCLAIPPVEKYSITSNRHTESGAA